MHPIVETYPIRDMVEGILEQATNIFKQDGHISGILFLNIENQVIISPTEMYGGDSHQIHNFLLGLATSGKLKEYVFVFEGYMAQELEALNHKRAGRSLKEFPGRKEIVMLQYANPSAEKIWIADIDRNDNGSPVLKEWQKVRDQSESDIAIAQTIARPRFNGIWSQVAANAGVN